MSNGRVIIDVAPQNHEIRLYRDIAGISLVNELAKAYRNRGYVDMPGSPLFELGFGLSYTAFEYSNLQISPTETGTGGSISISVDVKISEKKQVKKLYNFI